MHISELHRIEFEVPSDWVVRWNEFYGLDPEIATSVMGLRDDGGYTVWDCFFSGDLIQIVNLRTNQLIDVGWEPARDSNGHYHARLLEPTSATAEYDWELPAEHIETRNPQSVIDFIYGILKR